MFLVSGARVIREQVLRSGLMELEETLYWLELLEHTSIVTARKLAGLKDESDQLTAILVTLIKRAKR